MRVAAHLAVVLAAFGALAGADEPASTAAARAEIAFPVTFDRVWYRTGAPSVFGGAQHKGFLTINRNAIELVGRKISLVWPLESVRMISLGHLAGDVDTEWVVLDVASGEEATRVGFRHGGRYGWGRRTGELFQALREAARLAGAAQFAAPKGYEPYTELDFQFAMPIPEGWRTHHQSVVGVEGRALHGTLVAAPEPLIDPAGAGDQRAAAVERIASGEIVAWVVNRRLAPPGFDCGGAITEPGARLGEWIAAEPALAEGVDLSGAVVDRAVLGGCTGFRLVALGPRVLDLRAVSDGDTLFLVGLRVAGNRYEVERARFEAALAGFRLTRTR